MAVLGSSAGGFSIQRIRLSGEFGSSPAIMVRREKNINGGPTTPRAVGTPGMVWHAPHPYDWMSWLPRTRVAIDGDGVPARHFSSGATGEAYGHGEQQEVFEPK